MYIKNFKYKIIILKVNLNFPKNFYNQYDRKENIQNNSLNIIKIKSCC